MTHLRQEKRVNEASRLTQMCVNLFSNNLNDGVSDCISLNAPPDLRSSHVRQLKKK